MADATTKWLPNPSAERGGDPLALWRKASANVYSRFTPPKIESAGEDVPKVEAPKEVLPRQPVMTQSMVENWLPDTGLNLLDYSGGEVRKLPRYY